MYKEILDTIPYPCSFVSKDYKYLAVNKVYSEFYNTNVENIIGKHLSYFLGENLFNLEVKPKIDLVLSGKTVNYEIVVPFNKKDVTIMKMKYTPYKNDEGEIVGIVSHGEDITIQKQLKEELQFSESYFNSAFNQSPNIAIITNGEAIDKANKKMLDFVGFSTLNKFKENHECLCDLFIKGNGLLQAQMENKSWLEHVLENKNTIHRVQMKKNNTIHEFIVNANEINLDKHQRSIVVFSDVTQIKKADQLIHEQEELLIAQSRHAAMGEMISMIAHQWRQPITVISMEANNILADIELEQIDTNNLIEYANMINTQTSELSNTIDDFRDFFKPIKEKELTTIDQLYSNTYAVIGKSLENHGIAIEKNCDNDFEFYTYTREFMQVLINIIKNAKEVLIEKKIENPKIKCDMRTNLKELSISICDNGGGIPNNIIDKVFDPYVTTKGVSSGTGLGLYISKTIIEQHMKGTINVHNTKDGACFNITIPI